MLFWASAALSIATLYASQIIPWKDFQALPVTLFSVAVVFNAVVALRLRFGLLPLALHKRRQQLLSDSLGVPLISEKTQNYYNNPCLPSLTRLGASLMENSYFGKNICAHMARTEHTKIAVYGTVWLLALLYRGTDPELIGIVTQVVFSAEVITRWLGVESLRRTNEVVFDQLYREFLHKVDLTTPDGSAAILDAFATYETAKSVAGIKLSSKVFFKLNDRLSHEWDEIREELKIGQT